MNFNIIFFQLASCNKSENVIISSISMIDIMYASYTDIKNGLIYKECFNSNIGGFSSMKYVNMFYEIVNEKVRSHFSLNVLCIISFL